MQNPKELSIKPDKFRIVKSNKLVESRQTFSALQQRIIAVLASRIQNVQEGFLEHEFDVRDFFVSYRAGGSAYESMTKALSGLLKSAIEIRIDENKWKGYSLLSSAEYDGDTRKVILRFSNEMKPFYLHLTSNYTSYLLRDVHQFQKAHTIRIYELCKQYFPKIRKRKFELDQFKFLLSIEKKYPKWQNLKDRVISPSIIEINEHSDIFLEYEVLKTGRKITGILFLITANPNNSSPTVTKKNEQLSIASGQLEIPVVEVENVKPENTKTFKVPAWITEKNYDKIRTKYDLEVIKHGIERIEAKGDSVKNKMAYLVKGLREGWFIEIIEIQKKEQEEEIAKRNKKRAIVKQKELLGKQEQISKQFDKERKERMCIWLENIEEDTIEMFIFENEDVEDNFLKKTAKRLSEGKKKEMDLKTVVKWDLCENSEASQEDVMFARATKEDLKYYAEKYHSHQWIED